MDRHPEAVTTSYHPRGHHLHGSNTLADSFNNPLSRATPVQSQSVDFDYNLNRSTPMVLTGGCGQQDRLIKHASFDNSGLSPYGQHNEPARFASSYGHSSRSRHGPTNTSPRNTGNVGSMAGYSELFAPDKRNCSVCTVANERYQLDAKSLKDHENEDDFMIYVNNYSLVMCVFDGHDGARAVKFAMKYMKGNIFDTKSWMKLSENNMPEEIETVLPEFIKITDADFFKSIQHFIDEKLYLQSQIPKVIR